MIVPWLLKGDKLRELYLIDPVKLAGPVPSFFVQVSTDPGNDSRLARIVERKVFLCRQHFFFRLVHAENFNLVFDAPLHIAFKLAI